MKLRNIKTTLLFLTFSVLLLNGKKICAQEQAKVNIYFETNSYTPAPKEMDKLNAFMLELDQVSKIAITAYCDDTGQEETNKQLALKRAAAISKLLLYGKVDSSRIENISAIGEVALDALGGDTLAQRARNRRVEIRLSAIKNIFTGNLRVGNKLIVDNILFEGDRHEFLPESLPALKNLVNELQEQKQYSIRIEGHICGIGLNKGEDGTDIDTHLGNLSEARAKAVYTYLIKNGISESRLAYKGMKGDFPSGRGEKFDRRVEVVITGISK